MVLGLELLGEKDDLCFLVLGLDPNPSKLFEILFEFQLILSVKNVIYPDWKSISRFEYHVFGN